MDVTKRQSFNGFMIEKFMKKIIERSKKNNIIDNNMNTKNISVKKPKLKKYIIEDNKLSKSTLFFIKEKNTSDFKKVIYQLHGGSYLTPHVSMYFKNATRYLRMHDDMLVASLDYRIAPKNLYPSALEDAIEGWKYLLSKGFKNDDIIIVGDSAGGNLALALTMYLRDNLKTKPAGIILMSPWADLTDSGSSRIYNIHKDPMFGYSKLLKKIMAPDKTYMQYQNLKDSMVSPIFGEYDNFPPMLIQVGSHEVLESDSIKIYEKALLKQVNVKFSRYHNMFHCFQFFGSILPESKLAWSEVKDFIYKEFNFLV